MSRLKPLTLMLIFALAGCDRPSYLRPDFNPKKDTVVRSTGYVCEVDKFKEYDKKSSDKEAKLIKERRKGVDDYSRTLTFVLTEYEGVLLSEHHHWGERYFVLEEISTFLGPLSTYGKWPEAKYGFTKIVATQNGYDARTEKDGKLLRRNVESVLVGDGRLIAKFSDAFYDKDTLEEVHPSLKGKEYKLPRRISSSFTLNTVSGSFGLSNWITSDFDEKIGSGEVKSTHFYGTCKLGLGL